VDKTDVGLSAVDNTSDLDKPISTATQSSLDLKADSTDLNDYVLSADFNTHEIDTTIHFTIDEIDGLVTSAGTNGQVLMKNSNDDYDYDWQTLLGGGDMLKATYDTNDDGTVNQSDNALALGGELPGYYATSANLEDYNNPHQVDKTDVGLSAVDNTSDLDKPISTATQIALDLKADSTDLNDYTLSVDFNAHETSASIHFTEASIDHGNIQGLLDNDHPQYATSANLDAHTSDSTIHFTEASLDLNQYATSANLDTHTSDSTIHFTEASIDHGSISGLLDNDHPQYATFSYK